MRMIRVFSSGIAIGYLIGSGKGRELLERLQAAGGPQRLAPARFRRGSSVANGGDSPSDVAMFHSVPDVGARGSGAAASGATRQA